MPRPIRTYFDSGAHEWNAIGVRQKLLDLGYVTYMGYDIYQNIEELLESHHYIQEFEIKYSIGALMSELSGRSSDAISDRYENVPLKEMVNEFDRPSRLSNMCFRMTVQNIISLTRIQDLRIWIY